MLTKAHFINPRWNSVTKAIHTRLYRLDDLGQHYTYATLNNHRHNLFLETPNKVSGVLAGRNLTSKELINRLNQLVVKE